ncbi:MAG TPA: cyclase family protein [Blastocatellia bacterium]|nr:cyclase family protein [Blastocatellia bacterium]
MKAGQIMLTLLMLALMACSLFTVSCATQTAKQNARQDGFPEGQWIDLSHDLSSETIYWPTAEPFKRETVAEGFTEKGYYYSAYSFCAAEHGGTHIDAPVHFARGRNTVDAIPLSQLIAPAIKIDVSSKASANRDYQINVEDFAAWESANGRIPDGSIVLFETGFGQFWPDRIKYLGTDKRGPAGVAELHFPGLHPDGARWLVENRKISAVGLDTASIDYGQTQTFDSHVILMTNNIPAFENVANLGQVPKSGARVVALPIKIKGGSGGPLRIVAFIPAASS